MGVDVGGAPWVDVITRFEILPCNLIGKHPHLFLGFLAQSISYFFLLAPVSAVTPPPQGKEGLSFALAKPPLYTFPTPPI